MQSIAIFGGTFDPVHKAHIATAIAIQNSFHFDDFYFLPCKDPLIKAPSNARADQRVAMLERALKIYPDFKIDLREVKRDSPSYMVETLQSFRTEHPQAAITLIIGYDAFLSLPAWHQWQHLIDLANILIMDRVSSLNQEFPKDLKILVDAHLTHSVQDILNVPYGKILQFNAGNFDLSSTTIRQKIRQGIDVSDYLADEVREYITKFSLYK